MIDQDKIVLENDALRVTYDKVHGHFSIAATEGDRMFVRRGSFHQSGAGEAVLVDVSDECLGRGQAIEVVHPFGDKSRLILFPNQRFAFLRLELHNDSGTAKVVDRLRPFRFELDLGTAATHLKARGTGGLAHPGEHSGSYAFLAVADPKTRAGVVSGWVTNNRGSGVVFSQVEDERAVVEAQIDYGRLRVAPGGTEQTELFAIGYYQDARDGLEAYADTIARIYDVSLPPMPVGYCTWYSNPHGGASDAESLAQLTEFAAERLAPYGFNLIQIDDGWQAGEERNGPRKNFSTHRKDGPYPSGMKGSAEHIERHGLIPGIWFMPFAGDHLDPFFQTHPEWFVRRENGEAYESRWGGTSLDMTHPGARAYLKGVVDRIAQEWGYRYFKLDGLWTGSATPLMYVNDAYRDDGIGDARFHDPDKTNIEAYRDGLTLVREAAGEDVFFLGCCIPQNMRSFAGAFGLVDAMRIGPDNGYAGEGLILGPDYGARYYFLHGRVWYNDPDPVYVRPDMTLDEARLIASWVGISGQLTIVSEWLPGLPPERLEILKRIMPNHGLAARPVDYFDASIPRIWHVTSESDGNRRDVLALFNWDDDAFEFDESIEGVGLPNDGPYAVFDYWQERFLPPLEGRLTLAMPARSCKVLALRPIGERPQVISTSRHITQGIVDVLNEEWNPEEKTLSGESRVVAGDPYELRILTRTHGAAWSVKDVKALAAESPAPVAVRLQEAGDHVRVTIVPGETGIVTWSLRFD